MVFACDSEISVTLHWIRGAFSLKIITPIIDGGFGRGAEGWLRPGLYGGTYDLAGQSRRRRNRGRYASGSPRIARNHKAATLIPHAGSPHDFISVVSGAGLPRAQADDADDDRRVSRASGELHPLRFVLTCNVRFWPLADISCWAAYVCFRG